MIVSRGGLENGSDQIKEIKGYYLTRQRFMAMKFKQFFFKQLFESIRKDDLELTNRFKGDKNKFYKWASKIRNKHWIVSIQKPLSDIEQIVRYVGRYTKRACLSEYKIQKVKATEIKIQYNDYKNTPKNSKPLQSIKSFTTNEFLDALLQHVPIKRFKMVRYYGLYTSHYKSIIKLRTNNRKQKKDNQIQWTEFEQYRNLEILNGKPDPLICPHCKTQMFLDKVIYSNNIFIDDS